MFKFYYTIIIVCLTSSPLFSQGDCLASPSKDYLDVNNVSASLGVSDMINFLDFPPYEYPKGSGNAVIFNANLWMGGFDDQGQLKLAAQTYRQSGTDFYPGPIPNDGTSPTLENCSDYRKPFTVYGQDIDNFANIFNSNGTIAESDIPESIKNYPAKNNPFLQEMMYLPLDKDLAPFYDVDGDGEYNPLNGDYPSIEQGKPAYADQMIFKIINDAGNLHTESGGEIMNMEIGVMAYAFQTDNELNNCTFFNYTLNYYGNSSLNDFYLGIYVDPDLGGYDDDFIGCIPDKNIGYVYNAKETDFAYEEFIPLVGVQILEGLKNELEEEIKMSSFITFENDLSIKGFPQTPIQHYNYMKAIGKDELPITDNNNEETTFIFSGDPNNADEWSECSSNTPIEDKRFLMAMGPVNFDPGDSKTFKKCILITNKQSHYCGNIKISDLTDLGDAASAFIEDNFGFTGSPIEMPEDTTLVEPEDTTLVEPGDTTILALDEFEVNQLKANAYPNPASNYVFFEFNHPNVRFDKLIVRSTEGLEVYNADISETNRKIQMDRGSLKSGVYFYQFYDKGKIITTGKFIFE